MFNKLLGKKESTNAAPAASSNKKDKVCQLKKNTSLPPCITNLT